MESHWFIPKLNSDLNVQNHYILAEAGVEYNNGNSNNVIFTIKDTILYVPVVILSDKDNQKLSKLLSKGFERQCTDINIK